jgi:hypothetical protein
MKLLEIASFGEIRRMLRGAIQVVVSKEPVGTVFGLCEEKNRREGGFSKPLAVRLAP